VIALAGEGLLLHVAEQRVHLNGIEAASGAHAAMACHGGEHMVETFRNNKAPLPFGKLVGEIVHQPLDIGLAKQCRNFAHDQRGCAEALNHAAETSRSSAAATSRPAASASSSTTSGINNICRESPPAKALFKRS